VPMTNPPAACGLSIKDTDVSRRWEVLSREE
jgi:hypothetical protein